MRYIRQLAMILCITCLAEIMKFLIPLPIPASIYGLVFMYVALRTGIIKLDQVKETADFLIEIMPLMFIPAAVGLLESWDAFRPLLLPVVVIIPVTTFLVMGVTGRLAQYLLEFREKPGAPAGDGEIHKTIASPDLNDGKNEEHEKTVLTEVSHE